MTSGFALGSALGLGCVTPPCGLHVSEAALHTSPPVPRSTDLTKQIIIGTPGTVLNWFFKRKLFDLTKIRVFVLDEADVMIDTQGFSDQSIRIQRYPPGSASLPGPSVCRRNFICQLLLLVFPAQSPAPFSVETSVGSPGSLSPLALGCWGLPASRLLSSCTALTDEPTDWVLPQNLPIHFLFYIWSKILKRIYCNLLGLLQGPSG